MCLTKRKKKELKNRYKFSKVHPEPNESVMLQQEKVQRETKENEEIKEKK